MASLKEILSWFEKNKYPTQEQFKESWTSFWHKSEKMPMEQVVGLQDELSDKALKSDLNAVETELKDKASKEELDNVVAGLVPMGSVADLVELETKPKRNNDSYYVEDQLSPEGDAYIYRWDDGLNLWVNTKQVAFKGDIAKSGGLNVTLADIAKNVNKTALLINNTSSSVSIDTINNSISFASVRYGLSLNNMFYSFRLKEPFNIDISSLTGNYNIFYVIGESRLELISVTDSVNYDNNLVSIGFIQSGESGREALVTLYCNLYKLDGSIITPLDSDNSRTLKNVVPSTLYTPKSKTALSSIKHFKVIGYPNDVCVTYLGDTKVDPKGFTIRDSVTRDILFSLRNLESNRSYNKWYDLGNGEWALFSFEIDFSKTLGVTLLNGFNEAIHFSSFSIEKSSILNSEKYKYLSDDNILYPFNSNSTHKYIKELHNAITDISIAGFDKNKFYSFWIKAGGSLIELVESDSAKGENFKAIARVNPELKKGLQIVNMFPVRPTSVVCKLMIDTSKFPDVTIDGSTGAYDQNVISFHNDVLSSTPKRLNPIKTLSKSGVGFKPFIEAVFDNKWMCNESQKGFSEEYMFALDSWDNNTFLENTYNKLLTKYPRWITRTEKPIYSIKDIKGRVQDTYMYTLAPEHYSKTIFIVAGQHSRESEGWLGVAKSMQLIYDYYEDNEALSYLRNNVRFMIIPILNTWGMSSYYPRNNDLNANKVNTNRNWAGNHSPSVNSGEYPFSEIETRSVNDIIIKYKDEIDFISDCHTTVNSNYGDYSLDFGSPKVWGMSSIVQMVTAGYLLTKNVINEDKRITQGGLREPNVPYQPYFGPESYAPANTFTNYCRNILGIPASTFEHSDFVWSNSRATDVALKYAVEWYVNLWYNISRNL